jgi:hypothetical protein
LRPSRPRSLRLAGAAAMHSSGLPHTGKHRFGARRAGARRQETSSLRPRNNRTACGILTSRRATFHAGMNLENSLRVANLGSAQTVGCVRPACPLEALQQGWLDSLCAPVQSNWHGLCCVCRRRFGLQHKAHTIRGLTRSLMCRSEAQSHSAALTASFAGSMSGNGGRRKLRTVSLPSAGRGT